MHRPTAAPSGLLFNPGWRRGLGALLLLLGGGCSTLDSADGGAGATDAALSDAGGEELGRTDSGPVGYDAGPLHNLTELTIEGRVALDYGAPGPRVEVTTHCNEQQEQILTNDDGSFTITANVEACMQLVVEFRKESYLPTYRVVHLPPPTSPVTMNLQMIALKELQCGADECVIKGDTINTFPPGPMSRGWVLVLDGPKATEHFGGEFRDTENNILWVTGFGYFDLRNASGLTMEQFEPFNECFMVGFDGLDQIVDQVPETNELEMNAYTLEAATGRWRNLGPRAWVAIMKLDPVTNEPIAVRASRAKKDDIRSNQVGEPVAICTSIGGSGWLAWGVSIAERSCVALTVTNHCGWPLPNVVYELQGRDDGYWAASWSDRLGRTCLEAARSEPAGQDFNSNEMLGETFWVNARLTWNGSTQPFYALELPRTAAGCADPASCLQLTYSYQDFTNAECRR